MTTIQPSGDTLLPQDAQFAERLRQEMIQRQLIIEAQARATAAAIQTEQQLHIAVQKELEAYALHLEQWKNDKTGRSTEQQLYIEDLAKQLRTVFTQSALERLQLTQLNIKRVATDAIPPPQPPPVIDVTPKKPLIDWKPIVARNIVYAWILIWIFLAVPFTSLWEVLRMNGAGSDVGENVAFAYILVGIAGLWLSRKIEKRLW